MESIEDIVSKLETDDIETLKACNDFIDGCAEKERLRGEAAESRANIILGVVGAVSAFMVYLASTFFVDSEPTQIMFIILYAAAVLWLARSIWYVMQSIRAQSRYRVTVDTIFEYQKGSHQDTIKNIVAGKYWEHQQSIKPNSERLFYVQRAQRSLIMVVGLLLSFGIFFILNKQFGYSYGTCLSFFVAFVLVVFLIIGDWCIEKMGIWGNS